MLEMRWRRVVCSHYLRRMSHWISNWPVYPEATPGKYVLIKVVDTGAGIPLAIRQQIFDRFFTTKEVGKGTGLGLATVQAIVKSHGGFIDVISEEGHGTQFEVYLPAFAGEQDAIPRITPESLQYGEGETVLVVDDEESVRVITRQTLEAFGYRVLSAQNGIAAIAVYEQNRAEIAVVLTDIMMPAMDGIAAIQVLRKINSAVKIIAVSGLADDDMITKAINAGVLHFLPKPFTSGALLQTIAEILERSASGKQYGFAGDGRNITAFAL